ncbi:hypothetical protein O1611_g7155 [Lasiodiplodia mahajangana]|uniref:Uncharacterized protein n=1 Tax=Lasiodiplodia mahajangana TaxID=1108764 RepID=A0ACC2JGH1_9PEZI|nr:hypothetical protein O1611_g7155 [Lasiodiplodia mahajangana]
MSSSMPTEPQLPTFGVEIEFLVATLYEGDEDPHRHVEGLAPALRIPASEMSTDGGQRYTFKHVKAALDEYFSKTPPQLSINNTYKVWKVESDMSIYAVNNITYSFIGVEINSPVLYASPGGFDTIKFAVSLITSKFRSFVNVSCGLHVHVGLGAQKLPLEHIRRTASLSYAIEPLLFTLHDPVRRINSNSRPLRDHSVLAKGSKDDVHTTPDTLQTKFHHFVGRDRRHGENPVFMEEECGEVDESNIEKFLATRKPGHFEPFRPDDSIQPQIIPDNSVSLLFEKKFELSRELDFRISAAVPSTTPPTTPPRKRNIPRLQFPHYDLKRSQALDKVLSTHRVLGSGNLPDEAPGPGISVFEATQWLYSQPASCHIAQQLSLPKPFQSWRMAISFGGYRCDSIGNPRKPLRTLEFRMGEGSLDSEWISTWAKICTGIFRFALYSSPSDFLAVLANCDRASKEDGSYDVVDLLDEIGLFAEAEQAEKRLMAHKDQWKLNFVEELKASP